MRTKLFLLPVWAACLYGQTPLTSLPYTPGLDPQFMDPTVQPCENFYQYACGNWNKLNPIPPDQPRWNVYARLAYDNQLFLWGLLLEAGRTDRRRSASEQKIGDLFGACMNESAIERAMLGPLRPDLDRIAAIRSLADLPAYLASRHLATAGSGEFFNFGSGQDYADADSVIAFATSGGLGMPDRDYYTSTGGKADETRQKYLEHVGRMFALLGDSPEAARREAETVMRIETALAKASLTRAELRNPQNLFHKMPLAELGRLTPSFRWNVYLKAVGAPPVRVVNVSEPAFYRELEKQFTANSVADLKTYLRWHAVHADARFLAGPFVRTDFDFFSHYLRGVPEMQPRWRRCVQVVDRNLGDALGQVFVTKAFPPEAKARALEVTRRIEAAMQREIEGLPWMSPETKREALIKLRGVTNKIGYPDRWRDYGSVEIRAGDYFGDVQRAIVFESHRQLKKIGRPADRAEWYMSAPTVNAYYDGQMNDINFPAGVLQPPLFDPKMDDAPNYGNTGATIGHELTHGFDDEGRQFDAKGNLKDWWTRQDAAEFQKRADCVGEEYSRFTAVDDVKINGSLTMGENIADLGGQLLAWIAWKSATEGGNAQPADGLTPEQRFFVGMAQWACGFDRPEDLRANAIIDPHAPDQYRINGVVSNMPEFRNAFSCREGQPMVRPNSCKVW